MLKKLSRIFGVTGSVLTMLPYAMFIGRCVIVSITSNNENDLAGEGKGLAFIFLFVYIIPTWLSSAGFIASFFVRKRPLSAGAVMALSSLLNLLSPPNYSRLLDAARVIAALLLIAAGTLAIISASKTSSSEGPVNKSPGSPVNN